MNTARPLHYADNVVDIFTGRPLSELEHQRIIRLAPELDGLEMLYSNDYHPDKLFSMKILCWALHEDGEISGLAPWLDKVVPCQEISDPLKGRWEGYYDAGTEQIFGAAPMHKVVELESAADYYDYEFNENDEPFLIQEIPDTIGTHAVTTQDHFQSFELIEVFSWQLLSDGTLQAMIIDENKVETTPVLLGDECLFPAHALPGFTYFFQHHIANKIKAQDPEALQALAMLMDTH